jgi:hypothetical protein
MEIRSVKKVISEAFAAPRASLGSKCPSCSTFLTAAYIARLPSRCCMPTSEHAQQKWLQEIADETDVCFN